MKFDRLEKLLIFLAILVTAAYIITLLVADPSSAHDAGHPQSTVEIREGVGHCESTNNYTKVWLDVDGQYVYGKYQFKLATWDATMEAMGWTEWIGVLPSNAPPGVQDGAFHFRWDELDNPHAWHYCHLKVLDTPPTQAFTG